MPTTNADGTVTEVGRELFQNHEHRRCDACGKKIMKSRSAYRWATGHVRHTDCPEPSPAPVAAAAPVVSSPVASARPTFHRCPRCGAAGYAGRHPFSTCPTVACDDCL
jgi:uncharacterized protein with PIN domain